MNLPGDFLHWNEGKILKNAELITSSGLAMSMEGSEFAARIRARDSQALEAVVHAYLSQILRAARGAGLNPQQAEEVTQATFVTFIETAPRFEGRSHVRTWLFGILYKKIAEARRNFRRDRQMEDIEEVVERRFRPDGNWMHPPRPVHLQLQQKEIREGIQGCLDTVPPKQRMAFVFREIEGLSTGEICKILEVTDTNLGVLLYRARNRLRECLETKGVKG